MAENHSIASRGWINAIEHQQSLSGRPSSSALRHGLFVVPPEAGNPAVGSEAIDTLLMKALSYAC